MFENIRFSAEDSILVFDFFTRLKKAAATLDIIEANVFLIIFKRLSVKAERHLQSIRNGAQSRSVTCRPDAVN